MTEENASLPVHSTLPQKWYARRWVVVVLAMVLFASGALVGGGGTFAFVVSRARHAARHPDEAHRRVLERMVGKLDLTPEQQARVQGVIGRRQSAMRAMRRDFQPRVRQELEATVNQVEAELNPEQAKRWRMMVERMMTNWMPGPEGDVGALKGQ
jgi:hypothetical protein